MKEITVNIFEQIGSTAAVASEDGEKVFNRLMRALHNEMIVKLDFKNIELITTSFLNAAIGQLYSIYDSQFLRDHLKVENMAQEDLFLVKKVTDRAKAYFKSQELMEKSFRESLGND